VKTNALTFSAEDEPSQADLDTVDAGLHRHNLERGSVDEVRNMAVFARDASGAVRGGAVGRYWGRYCELQQLWVDEPLRWNGIGARLLDEFEVRGASLGCSVFTLETLSFQAPGFYEKRGYEVVLRQDGFPHGHVKFSMRKTVPGPVG
jgi:GNAT superfamily N-acetyltransferase